MKDRTISSQSPSQEYLNELLDKLSNPIHKRMISAYEGNDPVQTMESELRKILTEVLRRES
jgi:hypothetical protein